MHPGCMGWVWLKIIDTPNLDDVQLNMTILKWVMDGTLKPLSHCHGFHSWVCCREASITISQKMSELDERVKAVEKPEEELYWRCLQTFNFNVAGWMVV